MPAGTSLLLLSVLLTADSAVAAARAALDQGLAWRATRLLAPVLADRARRTPEAVAVAAHAAAAWGGWAEVARLLEPAAARGDDAGGQLLGLLARAEVELGRPAALAHAAAAESLAVAPRERMVRAVVHARALEALGSWAAAAAAYGRAAHAAPDAALGSWFQWRALRSTLDDSVRRALAHSLAGPPRDHLALAEATALERAGHSAAAAVAWGSLGRIGEAWRVRVAAARTRAERARVRADGLTVLRALGGTRDAAAAVALLDSLAAPRLTAREELAVGRALQRLGPLDRAADGFRRAFLGKQGTMDDRLAWGDLLVRQKRYRDAAPVFAAVRGPAATTAQRASAAYQAARALVRDGRAEAGREALKAVLRTYPREPAAALALTLLADLDIDVQRDDEARAHLRQLVQRFPTGDGAPAAAFRAALIALVLGRSDSAAAEFEAQAARTGPEALAALYWAGRARAEAGDTAAAGRHFRQAMGRDSVSYYHARAARRLGLPSWTPRAAPDTFLTVPTLDSALARAAVLDTLGLVDEAGWEREGALRRVDPGIEGLLAAADACRRAGLGSLAIPLARRARDAGAPRDARLYRLLYPLAHQATLEAEARERGIDPALAAGLIRQESLFDAGATSRAGARGLMQLLPEVGRLEAGRLGFPLWDPALLWQPQVNLQLGMAHLAALGARLPRVVEQLGGYNAGGERAERWRSRSGAADDEIYADRIPFAETREYVKVIQRNREFYASLYPWP